MAEVDVRIPTLGTGPYLVEAVESVVAQTYCDWRLVVQENGPGDEAVRHLLEPYLDDPRVSHEVTGRVLSQADNWSLAVTSCTAPYVALLHDDDVWAPEYLERRAAFLDEHPECGFVCSSHVEIDEDGRELVRRPFMLRDGVNAPEETIPVLIRWNFIQPPTLVVRRSAYEAVGPRFDGTWPAFIDFEMWLRLALRFPVGYLAVHDCSWRVHSGSATAVLPPMGEPHLAFLDHLEELTSRERPGLRLDDRLARHKRAYAHVKAALDAAEAGDRGRAFGHLRSAVRVDRRALLDPRTPVAVVAALGGKRMTPALVALRGFVRRRELNLHVRGKPI